MLLVLASPAQAEPPGDKNGADDKPAASDSKRSSARPKKKPRNSKKKREKPAFRAEWLTPYLTTGPAGQARDALVAGKAAKAVKLLLRHLKRRRPASPSQARFLLAHALLGAGQFGEAAALFDGLADSYPLLQDYHRFFGARCRYRLKQFTEAEALASKLDQASPLYSDAQLLRADALRALAGEARNLPHGKAEAAKTFTARHQEVVKIWKAFLKRYPGGKRVGQGNHRLAQSLEQLAAVARGEQRARLLAEALGHYKEVVVRAPLWPRAKAARKRVAALARRVAQGAKLAQLSPWDQYRQARAYYLKVRHEQAEAAFGALLRRKQLSDRLRCKATYHLAMTVFRRRERARSAPIFARAVKHCRAAGEEDLTVKSLYNGAKGLMRAHRFDEAIAQFGKVEQKHPRHSYADDARLWAAEAAEAKGDEKQARRLLTTLPDRYPGGDQRREALWRLARAAIISKDHKQALAHLDRALKLGRATYYYAQGQAQYWKARILEEQKQPKAAQQLFEQCIRDYPLSYYSLMSFNRLRERHAKLYRKLWRELILPAGKGAKIWRFEPRELFGRPGFLRGVELARLGFGAEAAAELARVGVGIRRSVPKDDLWLAAVLFDRAGLWDRSHQVPRSLDHSYRASYPLGQEYRRWRIAYPPAYRSLVESNARQADVPPELVWAVMREESGFDPTIESWANAVGLMQLLIRTAKRAGSAHRLEVDRQRLHDPAVNIKLGATYLGFLRRTFDGNLALAIAGYNAGEGAVLKWLKRMGSVPLDEFLDRIPYDQTRRYTKRVLSSLLTCSVLSRPASQRIPRLSQKLPTPQRASLGGKGRKAKKPSKGGKPARSSKKPPVK